MDNRNRSATSLDACCSSGTEFALNVAVVSDVIARGSLNPLRNNKFTSDATVSFSPSPFNLSEILEVFWLNADR
jgi:hypothetical protein